MLFVQLDKTINHVTYFLKVKTPKNIADIFRPFSVIMVHFLTFFVAMNITTTLLLAT